MDPKTVVRQALEAGVALYLQEGKLAYKARRGGFPEALKALVRTHKSTIEHYLSTLSAPSTTTQPELVARGLNKAPLSIAQERLWTIDRLTGRSPHYNLLFAIEMKGECRADLIGRAIAQIVDRHEALRTNYVEEGQEVYQVVRAEYEVPFAKIDLSVLQTDEQQARLQQLMSDEAVQAFDLCRDVLLRSSLVRLCEDVHILLVNVHHIAADGWSIWLLVREFCSLYEAFTNGEDCPVPQLPLQYSDYAQWQREHLSGAALDAHLAHWLPALADLPQLHNLRTDRVRPPVFSFRGAAVESKIERDVVEGLQRLGQRTNSTLFIVMQAAMTVLLQRYSGESKIVIGTVVANREQEQIADLIGCFINVLVFKHELDEQTSFADLLAKVRSRVLDGMAHQQLPFEVLLEKLQPARTLSHSPLFQLAMLYQNNASETFALPGLSIRFLEPPVSVALHDLTLVIKEASEGLRLSWEYAIDLFDASTIARMAASFEVLLKAIVAAPEQSLHALPVLDVAERERVLFAFNDTACDFPDQALLHELIEATVAAHPDAIAVAFEDRTLSYGELNARANQVAHALLARGVRPDDRVAICAERSLDLVVGLLGILKSGAAYVPMDPGYPAERLAHMLGDCAPVVLLTQTHILALLPTVEVPLLRLDAAEDLALLAAQPRTNPDTRVLGMGSRNLAYVIYTSGSTGLPKGAMNEHRAVVNRLLWAQQEYALGPDDCVLQKTPFGFDVSVWEFFLPLLAGARLVLARPGGHQEPDYLVELIASAGVTTLHFVPSMLPAFLAHARAEACVSIRRILCSGEALPFPMQQQVLSQLPHVELHNLYGPTEAAIDVTSCRCELGKYDGIVPIGRPIDNTSIYILDAQLEPVPIGAPGEIHIAGVGVARGYLNRPELTQERFVADRFSADAAARMYKTGDLARWLPDGSIEYLGRNDFQVKLRGFRIELGEIETRLGACAGVREAVVIAREDTPGDQRLVAYVVMEGDLNTAGLREQLARDLPEFMIPSAFVAMDVLPLTPNGKLDRKALPAPDLSAQLARQHVAPVTDTEHTLCEIWQSLLKLDRVGIDDNFFEIGGHSLLATRVTNLIEEQCGRKVSVRVMFERPTIAELGAYVDSQAEAAQSPIPTAPADRPIPLSFAQQRLWFIDNLAGSSPQYNMPAALRLDGSLDREALRKSLETILERHAVLRTVYASDTEGPVQIVQPATALVLPVLDLTGLEPQAQAEAVDREVRAEAAATFDLSRDRMLRVRLLALAERQNVLLLTMHHIASDGWSIGVLTQELTVAYAACCEGRQVDLPALPIQYTDYAHWQRETFTEGRLQAQWQYWEDVLRDVPVVHNLPLDRPRPPQQQFEGAILQQRLDADALAGLKQLAAKSGTTLFVVLQSALAVLLSRWSNELDIVIGSPVAGRTHHQLAPLIGFFVNTLAFRHRLSRDLRFEDVLANARHQALDAFSNQDIPFEALVDRLQMGRSLAHSPVFQIVLNLQNNEAVELHLPGLESKLLSDSGNVVRFDLEIAATEADDTLWLSWNYAVSLFDAASIRRLSEGFALLIRGVLADSSTRVADLPVLTEADRVLQADWCRNDGAYPADRCIQQIFEDQVKRAPDAVAVVLGAQSLTYGELNSRANRIAHHLLSRGVKPEQLVGISVERSLEMIVAVFAILKAGAAYVPFDASYPDARLREMLEDSEVDLVLTQERMLKRGLVEADRCILLDDPAVFAAHPDTNPAIAGLTPDHLAYVIYTSGSTGKPKGAAIPHRGVTRLVDDPEYVPLGPGTRTVQLSAFAFDSSVLEIYGALLNGGVLVLYPGREIDVAGLPSFLREHQVNTLWLTSALFETWAEMVRSREDVVAQYVLMGGDVVSARTVEKVYALDPEVTIVHAYGPTENTVFTTCHVVSREDAQKASLPIGRPVKQTSLHVLDPEGRPVPVGVAGELYVGGAGLARGYWNRPELTREKFLHLGGDGERLYKTGDLVKFLADGNLQFVGRADNQVKIRGFRVEPGEIEYQLRRNPSIADALVVVDGTGAEKRLVAYIIARQPMPGAPADLVDAIREELKQNLAAYLVPNVFLLLDAFPVTLNGKVDRAALPKVDFGTYIEARFVPPSTETEATLADIWQRVLGLEKVGVTVDFFQVGGNSLNMTRLQNEIRRVHGLNIPLKALFSRTTILEQAQLIAGMAVSLGASEDSEEMIEEIF